MEVTKAFWQNAKEAYSNIKKLSLKPDSIQILTGHGAFAAYLCKYKRKYTPVCICDDITVQTLMRVLIDCPLFSRCSLEFEIKTGYILNLKNFKYFLDNTTNRNEKEDFLDLCASIVKRCRTINGSKII